MKVNTTRFGVIEVDDSSVINLVQGPVGFEPQSRYCLVQHRPDTKFRWLQSMEEPGLAFVVIDPSEFFANYEFEISDADAEKIHLSHPEEALALAIVTVAKDSEEVTANLAAPILINSRELFGMQVVLQESSYLVKQPLAEQPVKNPARRGESAAGRTTAGSKAA